MLEKVCSQRRYARPSVQRLHQARPQIESGALRLIGGRLYRPSDCPYTDEFIGRLTIHSEVSLPGSLPALLLTGGSGSVEWTVQLSGRKDQSMAFDGRGAQDLCDIVGRHPRGQGHAGGRGDGCY
jgi:hypothetical protein